MRNLFRYLGLGFLSFLALGALWPENGDVARFFVVWACVFGVLIILDRGPGQVGEPG